MMKKEILVFRYKIPSYVKKNFFEVNDTPFLKKLFYGFFIFFILLFSNLKAQCPDSAGTLTGDQYLCTYGKTSVNFSSTVAGGVWSSDQQGIAKISSSGKVTAVSKGIATIKYSVTNSGCPTIFESRKVFVSDVPGSGPTGLSGSQTQCQGTTATYTITPDPYSSSYVWSYGGNGATITPSADGLSASIVFSNTATSGNIIVSSINGCGSAGGKYLYVTVNPGLFSVPVATGVGNVQCDYAEPKWNTVQNADGYYYDIATDNLFTNFVRKNVYVSGNNGSGQASNLPPGILYFRVRATNSCLTTSDSNVIKFSTKASFVGVVSSDVAIC